MTAEELIDNPISKEHIFNNIINSMSSNLNHTQLSILLNTLSRTFENINFLQEKYMLSTYVIDNESLIRSFILVKKLAGIKQSTIKAYSFTIHKFLDYCQMDLTKVDTNKIRCFLLLCACLSVADQSSQLLQILFLYRGKSAVHAHDLTDLFSFL